MGLGQWVSSAAGPLMSMMSRSSVSNWLGFNHRHILERAGLAVTDQADAIKGAGKIRAVHAKARLQNVKHANDPAGFARMGDLDFNVLEQRFLFEQRREF